MSTASEHINVSLAEPLREARRKAILTQKELAEQLGVSHRTVQNLEYGKVPRPALMRKVLAFIADTFDGQAA